MIGETRARKAGSNAGGLIPKPQHDKFPASTLVLYRLYRTSPSKSCHSERVPQNERSEETATPESCRLYSCGLRRACRMRRKVGNCIVGANARRVKSGARRQSHAYERRADQRPGDPRHTEADGMADLRALVCRSPGGGFFHGDGNRVAVTERIFGEIFAAVRDKALWRGHVVQSPGPAQQRHAFSF